MKTTLALAMAALALAVAGTADAHWLVEQPTPVGEVCLVNDHDISSGLRGQDADRIVHGLAEVPCHEH